MPESTALQNTSLTIQADQPKPISSDLFGIFFEDINYSADGGLYAELIQNRSFEYTSADNPDWNFFTGWELIQDGGSCLVELADASPIHPNNPHYVVLNIDSTSGEVGLINQGFDGIVIREGEFYDVSLFARNLSGTIGTLTVRLVSRTGEILGEAALPKPTLDWAKYTTTIQATGGDNYARFVLVTSGSGALALDVISLFPQKTFHNRANGQRADLAQVIADLKPKFMRFPGGCLAHGDGLDNMYRWKDTIGPIETRREQFNIWNYHQSVGLGYFEYFQFCEDIGAKPVPIVPAGVCCPNTGAKFTGLWEQGQQGLPMEDMGEYVQEVLDLIEWANGPITSTWGAMRAEAGHPEPFGLKYLGVGNEERITPVFKERFKMIFEAVKAKYPEIVIIGTSGPRPEGEDYDDGWSFAQELNVDMVDEHGYKAPDWYWNNLHRFDSYAREGATVYLGEFAAHDMGRANTLRSALAEAAYMTSLERNGDVVRLASYAPLLAKQRRTQWLPDLIYFDNTQITLSVNYYVQQLFSLNAGDVYLPITIHMDTDEENIAASCVQDTTSGDIIIKIVSRSEVPLAAGIDLSSVSTLEPFATCTVLTGDPLAVNNPNNFWRPVSVLPETSNMAISSVFNYEIPAYSLTIIRMSTSRSV
ncbi:MAG: alpha-N-arabinofuranosidase [Anaerolineaceae bacterium]|nr:alpha-N-arabinofuranosidase [Anaerolineaceae bacterium]